MPRARWAVTAALACAPLLGGGAAGAPPPGAGRPSPIQQRPRFESTVARVRVNVIVTDGDGRFVDDLRAEDFRVFEDGEPREVIEAQLVDLVAGEVTPLRGEVGAEDLAPGPPPAPGPGDPAATDMSPVAAAYGAVIFLIDFKGLDHTTQLHFTNQWERYLDSAASTAVPQAVYLIDQVGRLREILPLTADMDRIRAAQQAVEGTGLTRAAILPPPAAEGDEQVQPFEEFDRSIYSLRLLRQFCDALAARPGRTALVWVSPGVTLKSPLPSDTRGNARLPASRYEPNVRILRLQEELDAAANSANVSIYAVDPSRLIDLFGGAGGSRIGSGRDELGSSLRHAAAETGGKHFIGWADFGEVVEEIEQDSARYYLLTYPGPVPGGDGRYHEIRVEVDRPGVSIRSKEGYTDYSEEERRSRFVSAALMLPGSVGDLPVAAQVFRGAPGGERTDVMVAVAVGERELEINRLGDGAARQRIEVHGALMDEGHGMEIVAEMHRQVSVEPPRQSSGETPGQSGGEMPGQVTGETSDRVGAEVPGQVAREQDARRPGPARWLLSRQEWTLRPGRYDLRIMVRDTVSGRVGTAHMPVEIPAADADAWSTGDVVLLEVEGGAEPAPVVDGRVHAGSLLAAFIEVRGGVLPVMSGWLRAAEGGEAREATDPSSPPAAPEGAGAKLFAQPLMRDGGVHRGSMPLPRLPAGAYLLELRVEDLPAGRERTIEVPLHVGGR